jgi:arylsulfatase A-like enzyme
MVAIQARPGSERSPAPIGVSAIVVILLAIACGLAGGYLDLVVMTVKKYFWNDLRYFWSGRDFLWSVPLAHALVLAVVAVLISFVDRLRPRHLSLRAWAWLFATLALWFALLRAPLYGVCTLILAAGLARPLSAALASHVQWLRRARYTIAGLIGILIVLAAPSISRSVLRDHSAAPAPPATPDAPNVLLVVWDTVRADRLSLHGYARDTTPNLARWARRGVRYDRAVAPAPWTYPSHSSFFTGWWPFQLNTQWNHVLDTPHPTIAEFLAAHGYQTAGFAANTQCCSYETGLDRGFAHYEDYPLTARSLIGRTVPGNWLLKNLMPGGGIFQSKWIDLQSRNARGISDAFLEWLGRRRPDRPFFAYLNFFDAHEPYIPPPRFAGRFGIRPKLPGDFWYLLDYGRLNKRTLQPRGIEMASDCYDDCIAFLDDQLGRLLNTLQDERLLDRTVVIVTSDHGEAFSDHGTFQHGTGLHLEQIGVPLVILASGAPSGRVVTDAVSLRDLPATLVDVLGFDAASPFPGHSLAKFWRTAPEAAPPEVSPALTELAHANAFEPQTGNGREHQGFQMSLVASGRQFVRDGTGTEWLYDLTSDPFESVNLLDSNDGRKIAGALRKRLLDALTESPGSVEVENAYLKTFRQWLRSLASGSESSTGLISANGPR